LCKKKKGNHHHVFKKKNQSFRYFFNIYLLKEKTGLQESLKKRKKLQRLMDLFCAELWDVEGCIDG